MGLSRKPLHQYTRGHCCSIDNNDLPGEVDGLALVDGKLDGFVDGGMERDGGDDTDGREEGCTERGDFAFDEGRFDLDGSEEGMLEGNRVGKLDCGDGEVLEG